MRYCLLLLPNRRQRLIYQVLLCVVYGVFFVQNNKKQAIDGKTSARYTGIIGDFPDGFRQKERISMLDVLIIGAGVSGCAAAGIIAL